LYTSNASGPEVLAAQLNQIGRSRGWNGGGEGIWIHPPLLGERASFIQSIFYIFCILENKHLEQKNCKPIPI